MNRPLKVAIIGSGPAGLTAALTLLRFGVDVHIYEKSQEVKALGGGLALRPPATKALTFLGAELAEIGAASRSRYLRPDGRVLAVFPDLPEGSGIETPVYVSVLREGLYELLHSLVPPEVIHTGKDCIDVRQGVDEATVEFADGSRVTADVIIGADGIRSAVRTFLEGPRPLRPHDLIGWIGHTVADVDLDRSFANLVLDPAGLQASCAPTIVRGQKGWHWWFIERWPADRPPFEDTTRDEHIRDLARRGGGAMPALVGRTRRDDVRSWIIKDRPPLERWYHGRVCAIGDAAHATSPYAGYGAGMAVVDGFILGSELGQLRSFDRMSVEGVLRAFQAERKERADGVVAYAYALGQTMHTVDPVVAAQRDRQLDDTSMLQDRVDGQFGPELFAEYTRVCDLIARAPADRFELATGAVR